MIVKIRSKESNGWIYLDGAKKITKDAGVWCLVKGSTKTLSRVMVEKVAVSVEEYEKLQKLNKQIDTVGDLWINESYVKPYDYDVDGDLPISTDKNIYPLTVLDIIFMNGESETYVMKSANDAFIINDQGKTIERL